VAAAKPRLCQQRIHQYFIVLAALQPELPEKWQENQRDLRFPLMTGIGFPLGSTARQQRF
jgi:hypothetical protein